MIILHGLGILWSKPHIQVYLGANSAKNPSLINKKGAVETNGHSIIWTCTLRIKKQKFDCETDDVEEKSKHCEGFK